jgi:hypothetical protein
MRRGLTFEFDQQFAAEKQFAAENIEGLSRSWACGGAPAPGGTTASHNEKDPAVSAPVALWMWVTPSTLSVEPAVGSRTNGAAEVTLVSIVDFPLVRSK